MIKLRVSTFTLLWLTFAFAALILLAGCATDGVEVRTVQVSVPVPVSCVKPADIPAMPPRVGSDLTGDAVHDASVLAAYALRLRAALDKSLALLSACTTEK